MFGLYIDTVFLFLFIKKHLQLGIEIEQPVLSVYSYFSWSKGKGKKMEREKKGEKKDNFLLATMYIKFALVHLKKEAVTLILVDIA